MNQELFVDFLKHFRKCVLGGVSVENPHLLLLDRHGSHMGLGSYSPSKIHGARDGMYTPHSSHRLRPLDIGVFRPVKVKFGQMRSDLIFDSPTWLNGENNKAMLA